MSKLADCNLNHPRKFMVPITEMLKQTVEVNADDLYKTKQMVFDGRHGSKYIFGSEYFASVKFCEVRGSVCSKYSGIAVPQTTVIGAGCKSPEIE